MHNRWWKNVKVYGASPNPQYALRKWSCGRNGVYKSFTFLYFFYILHSFRKSTSAMQIADCEKLHRLLQFSIRSSASEMWNLDKKKQDSYKINLLQILIIIKTYSKFIIKLTYFNFNYNTSLLILDLNLINVFF